MLCVVLVEKYIPNFPSFTLNLFLFYFKYKYNRKIDGIVRKFSNTQL